MSISTLCGRALTGLALASFVAGAAAAETWDMPTPYPDVNFHTRNIVQFADQVKSETGGAIDIVVHPNQSLVKHNEIKNAVRSGQVQIGEFLLSTLSNENPIYGIDSVPFLATGYDDAWKLWEASRETVAKLLDEQGLVLLYAVAWPPQGLYTKSPVDAMPGFAGLKFRTYNAATERLAQLVGGVPTQIEASDIPQAFATGRVDAMITSSSTGANSKAWDFLEYYYDAQAWLPKNVIVMNKEVFEDLDPAVQTLLRDVAKVAEERGWQMSKEEDAHQKKVMADNGMTVAPPSPAVQDGLKQVGATMSEEWASTAGAAGVAILEAYKP